MVYLRDWLCTPNLDFYLYSPGCLGIKDDRYQGALVILDENEAQMILYNTYVNFNREYVFEHS
jgi:hypothetical protein